MTVCYELPVSVGRYTVEYDRTAPWHAQWAVLFERTTATRPLLLRRYGTYTEARRCLYHLLKPTHKVGGTR